MNIVNRERERERERETERDRERERERERETERDRETHVTPLIKATSNTPLAHGLGLSKGSLHIIQNCFIQISFQLSYLYLEIHFLMFCIHLYMATYTDTHTP